MWEMASLFSYEENHDMEQLGQKLMCTTLELVKLKAEAMDEMRRNKDYIKQLIHLLKFAIQERDEARNQFQKLLIKTMPPTPPSAAAEGFSSLPPFHSDSPLLKPAKANSSITESNSLSETYNLHSHASTPVDSLFDAAVSSPDFSDMNNRPLIIDQATLIIDNLAKGRVLPQKGKLLQAVKQAGPLLQQLLVAGPLPTWRNPPQFQSFHIPPFSIKGFEGELSPSKPYTQLSCGSAQVQSAPMLTFASSSMMNGNGNGYGYGYGPLSKRQRFS